MSWMLTGVNALVQVTVWLALIWAAVMLLDRRRAPVAARALALRIGLAGVPIVLAVGLLARTLPLLPASEPVWRVANSTAPAVELEPTAPLLPEPADTGNEALFASAPAPADVSISQGEPMPIAESAERVVAAAATPATPAAGGDGLGATILAFGLRAVVWTLGLVWLAGAMVFTTRLTVGYVRLLRRRRTWMHVGNVKVRHVAAKLAGQIGLRRRFRLLCADDLPMPIALGVLRPAVAIPTDQFHYLAGGEGRGVLAHELAHLAGRDPLWRMLGSMVAAALWFHPLVHWLNRRIEIESEYLCDQAALSAGAEKKGYANLLISLAEIKWVNRPLAAAAIGAVHRTSHLERRLRMILSRTLGQAGRLSSPARWLAVALAATVLCTVGSVALLGEETAEGDLFATDGEHRDSAEPEHREHPDRPAEGVRSRPADRVHVTLRNGKEIEGVWLGSGPDGLRVLVDGKIITVPIEQIRQFRMIPGRVEHAEREGEREHAEREGEREHAEREGEREHAEREGEREHPERESNHEHAERDGKREHREGEGDRPREGVGIDRLRKNVSDAETHLVEVSNLPENAENRAARLEQAEQRLAQARADLRRALQSRESDRPREREAEHREGDDRPRDGERREGDGERDRPRDGEREGGDRPRDGVREGGDRPRDGKREGGDRPREGGDRPREAKRDGEREGDGERDGDKRDRPREGDGEAEALREKARHRAEEIEQAIAKAERQLAEARGLPEGDDRAAAIDRAERNLQEAREQKEHLRDRVKEIRKSRVEALREQANELARQGRWRQVLEKLNQIKELTPDDDSLASAYARTYRELGMNDKAEQAERQSAEQDKTAARVVRTYDGFRNSRLRERFEGALRDAPRTRWERKQNGSYVVNAPEEVHGKLRSYSQRLRRGAEGDGERREGGDREQGKRDGDRERERERDRD